jgi:transcriptional regulator with XRE-family HTH domain
LALVKKRDRLRPEDTERAERRGWSQRELAQRAGMPQSAIARLEKAGRSPTAGTLARLAHALGACIEFGPEYHVRLVEAEPSATPAVAAAAT